MAPGGVQDTSIMVVMAPDLGFSIEESVSPARPGLILGPTCPAIQVWESVPP